MLVDVWLSVCLIVSQNNGFFTRAVEDATIWAGFDTHGNFGNRKGLGFVFVVIAGDEE